jgi:hypothetical protein
MAAQVIIKLIADPTGLQPGVEALETLGQIDKATADEFKATNKAFQERAKVLNTSVTSTEKLSNASKKLVESIAGGAITQATQNIEKLGAKINKTTADTVAFTKAIELSKQKLSTLREGTADFDKLSNEIAAAELAMANFGEEATSSRGKLRQYRETLLQLEDAGLAGTQVFQDMSEAAGELQDAVGDTSARIQALGSDTFALDAGVQVIQGVAGAFSIAQGAAALFGDENKDLQQTLLKVNAAMAILQGITQIQTILQSESSASIAVGIALQRIQALQTNLQAAAESRFIIVRYAAIVAQKALNVVMALNPAGALLLTISAVAGALLYFTSNSDDAAESMDRLNQEIESQNEVLKLNNQSIDRNTALRVAQAKSAGLLASQIAEIERQGLRARASLLVEDIKLNQKALDNKRLTDEQRIALDKKVQSDQQELANINNQGQIKNLEIQETLAEEANKSATASAQARIAQAKKDSQSELNASIAAIRVKQREELAAEGITQGERELIVANNERAISQLVLQIRQKNLDDQIALSQANAIEQVDGFRKIEADIQVVILKAQKDTLGKSKEQAILIEAEKNAAIKNLRKQLFKDLEAIEITEFGRSKERQRAFNREVVNEEVLKGAQIAAARLQAALDANKALQAIDKKRLDDAKALAEQIRDTSLMVASSLAGSLNEIAKNQSDYELSLLKERLDKGLISQEQYDKKVKEIKIKQAQQDKALALFQATISTIAAVAKALPNIPLSVLAGILGAAQIAAIASKPIPAFKKGTKSKPFDGPGLIGEAGPELYQVNGKWGYAAGPMVIDMPKGSKVIPTLETDKIMQKYNMTMPPVRQDIVVKSSTAAIDYDKLARKFGAEMDKRPLHVSSFDKNGPFEYTTTVLAHRNYLKGRYGSR